MRRRTSSNFLVAYAPPLFFFPDLQGTAWVSVYFTLQMSPHFPLLSIVYYGCMVDAATQGYTQDSVFNTRAMSRCVLTTSSSTITHSSIRNSFLLNILNLRSQQELAETFGFSILALVVFGATHVIGTPL